MRKFRGCAKNRQPFSAVSGPKFTKFGACMGVPVDRQLSFRLLISCSVAEICSVEVQRQCQKCVFRPSPSTWSKRPAEFWPNFSNSGHKWICVQVWLRFVQWLLRLGIEKRRKKKERKKKPQRYYAARDITILLALKLTMMIVILLLICYTRTCWLSGFFSICLLFDIV